MNVRQADEMVEQIRKSRVGSLFNGVGVKEGREAQRIAVEEGFGAWELGGVPMDPNGFVGDEAASSLCWSKRLDAGPRLLMVSCLKAELEEASCNKLFFGRRNAEDEQAAVMEEAGRTASPSVKERGSHVRRRGWASRSFLAAT